MNSIRTTWPFGAYAREWAVVAAAMLAFIAACTAHEALGHGLACLATGSTIERVTTVYFQCRQKGLVADLGGPAANLVLWAISLALLRVRVWGYAARVFWALLLAFNAWWLAGCLMSAMAGASDFAYAVRLLGRWALPGRVALVVLGVAIGLQARYALAAMRCLDRRMARIAYATAGGVCLAATLAFAGPTLPALREAALESLGSMVWLLFMADRKADAVADAATQVPGWALRGWVVAAVFAFAVFAATLGQGYGALG